MSAIVVNFNGGPDLAGCVGSLRAQTHALGEVVVVDNASTDDSAAVLARLAAEDHPVPVRVVQNRTNRGYAGGANDGLAALGDVDAILVANPDVVARPDYLERAVGALASDPDVGAVQGRLHRTVTSAGGGPVIDTTGHVAFRIRLFANRGEGQVDRGQWDQPGEVFGVSGALALYRRSMLDELAIEVTPRDGAVRREVFDEDLFAFWEDVDLDWRASRHGWRCWYEPGAVAVHERGGAGPRRTAHVEELNFRNRLLVLVKNDRWRDLWPVLPGLAVTTLLKFSELLLTQPSAAIAVLARSWPAVAAVRRKRSAVHQGATVDAGEVVARWFQPFDHRAWVRTWWRRVRRTPVGHEPS